MANATHSHFGHALIAQITNAANTAISSHLFNNSPIYHLQTQQTNERGDESLTSTLIYASNEGLYDQNPDSFTESEDLLIQTLKKSIKSLLGAKGYITQNLLLPYSSDIITLYTKALDTVFIQFTDSHIIINITFSGQY